MPLDAEIARVDRNVCMLTAEAEQEVGLEDWREDVKEEVAVESEE